MESGRPKFREKLAYQDILSYHASNEKGCLRKEACFKGKDRGRVPNYRFWTDKAEDAA
jgi:hypothetical protein